MTTRVRWMTTTLALALGVSTLPALGASDQAQQPPPAGRQGGAQAGGRRGGGGGFPRVPALPFPAEARTLSTITGQIRAVPVVSGLVTPWSLAFLPNGDMLVTEKPGRLRLVRAGTLEPQPIAGVPAVVTTGQGGLMEVALHPRFAENRWVYFTYSKAGERGNTTALGRGKLEGLALTGVQDLFVADAWSTGGIHFGSKLAFAPDGTLFMTVGERNDRTRAQDLTHHAGKVLRVNDDGTVPRDNPFVGRADARPEIYSYGHRNLQGLAFHPETGQLWETEHGPQGGDELNIVLPGRNYGWPVITYGREYSGEIISANPYREGMEQPVTIWVPSIGLSGMAFYTGSRYPGWTGNLFVGGLSGLTVHRIGFNERGPIGREPLLTELRLRIRDVRQGPDGLLYVVTDANPGGVIRLEPVTPAAPGR